MYVIRVSYYIMFILIPIIIQRLCRILYESMLMFKKNFCLTIGDTLIVLLDQFVQVDRGELIFFVILYKICKIGNRYEIFIIKSLCIVYPSK